MILKYFNRDARLAEIRRLCNVTARDGSRAADLIRVAQSYGLTAKGFKMGSLGVRSIKFPAIIHWDFNHFIVLEGYTHNKYYLRDSCTGGFTATHDEFENNFTGIVIRFLEKSEHINDGEGAIRTRISWPKKIIFGVARVTAVLKKIVRKSYKKNPYVSRVAPPNLIYIGLCIIAFVLTILIPVVTKYIFDMTRTQQQHLPGSIWIWAGVFMVLYGLILAAKHLFLLQNKLYSANTIAATVIRKLLRLPSLFFISRHNVANRFFISSLVYDSSFNAVLQPVFALVTLLVFWIELYLFSPQISLLLVPLCVADLAVRIIAGKQNHDMRKKIAIKNQVFYQISINELERIETIKGNGTQQYSFQRWAKYQAALENGTNELKMKGVHVSSAGILLKSLCLTIIVMSSSQAYTCKINTGTLIALVIITILSFQHNIVAARLLNAVEAAKTSIKSLDDILNQADADYYASDINGEYKLAGEQLSAIELKSVSFGYNRFKAPQVKDFSLNVNQGEIVGVLGGSGSGKSILAKIASMLYQPWSGVILFDRQLSSTLNKKRIEKSIVLVEQSVNIFHGSIRDNLTLFNPNIPNKDLEKACRVACIHDDIISRTHGYKTILKNGGVNISGGQKQRIEIARALLAQPSILIMDEAINALDSITAAKIIANIRAIGCTSILFSHNHGFMNLCDRYVRI